MGRWAVVVLTSLGCLAEARLGRAASTQPLIVGAQVAYSSPHAMRLFGDTQVMATETTGLRVRAGPQFFSGTTDALIFIGPQYSIDALSWVPSFYLLGGSAVRQLRGRLHLGAELARYVSLRQALTLNVGGEWVYPNSFTASVGLGLSHHFF